MFQYIKIVHSVEYHVMFCYMYMLCNIQIRVNTSISLNIYHSLSKNIKNPFF